MSIYVYFVVYHLYFLNVLDADEKYYLVNCLLNEKLYVKVILQYRIATGCTPGTKCLCKRRGMRRARVASAPAPEIAS